MPNFRYRALNGSGQLVSGAIVAANAREVALRVDELGLVLVDNPSLEEGKRSSSIFDVFNRPKPEDVTVFTRDLALLLRAGARINDGLELLAADRDIGRLRPTVASPSRLATCKGLSGYGLLTVHCGAASAGPSIRPPAQPAIQR